MSRHILAMLLLIVAPFAARADFLYTFSNDVVPYTFSFTRPDIVTSAGDLGIAPFILQGFNFTQAEVFDRGGNQLCFFFATAGVVGDCGYGRVPAGDAVMFATFDNPTAIGSYAGFFPQVAYGIAGSPELMTIQAVPEPGTLALLGLGLAGLAFTRRRKQ